MLISTIESSAAYAKKMGFQENNDVKKLLDRLAPLLETDIQKGLNTPSEETASVVVELNRLFAKTYDTDFYF